MTGCENCMIVTDSAEALKVYKSIFDVEILEVMGLPKGQNEAVFEVYGTRFHMLDENSEMNMIAPKPGDPTPSWYNITVPDIAKTYQRAMGAGCTEISPITEIETHGVKTAMFSDPSGYIWQLHEIVREVSLEERLAAYK